MLRVRFTESLKDAMKSKDQRALSTVRMIIAKLKDKDIAARTNGATDPISDVEIVSMLQGMIKQRQESISLYEKGGRAELAQKEREEIEVIERYLPQQMSRDAVEAAVRAIVADTGASSIKDMGKVMAELKARCGGQYDGAVASAVVKTVLAS